MMVARSFGLATTLLATALFAGCGGGGARKPGDTVRRAGRPAIVIVEDDDPEMLAGIEEARSTVDRFITALESRKGSQSAFAVKVAIPDGDDAEHMWVRPVRYEAGRFFGRIGNDPDGVDTVEIGDAIDVPKDEISDWMYVENRKLMGGYTIRVLRDHMSEKEREELDRSVPFTID